MILKHFLELVSIITWGQILLKDTPIIWKCCLHVKHPQKKSYRVFSFSGMGSLYPVSEMMNTNQYIDVIQRKVVRNMPKHLNKFQKAKEVVDQIGFKFFYAFM